ncbi:hypothetical protein PAXRUDRAFT_829768 [Paxillus rubicundulus Ve08.2h10]|uniref:Uncharacterized protein n=1 Tax=Paxillus rubicundulus Ve08.2h10 TaxID=930991 RepID=A0A0D0DUD8_9AGAM|nr:hypothetical protein PAXRUDRAFT_829768 [Paxillus rubicundulus Ve08.2h10]
MIPPRLLHCITNAVARLKHFTIKLSYVDSQTKEPLLEKNLYPSNHEIREERGDFSRRIVQPDAWWSPQTWFHDEGASSHQSSGNGIGNKNNTSGIEYG